ncbi:MAG: hypothetical protein H6722_00035 [Sandaracinus sp.]|nr:hypothetical protein [Sandaracinus sp.]
MSSSTAPVLVPSQLPPGAAAWVRSFAERLRDEVAGPLFSATDSTAFAEALPGSLARGAVLRYRWLNSLNDLAVEQARELMDAWMRPPPPGALTELQHLAAGLLGNERSFQVQRALAMTFTDGVEGLEGVLARWSLPRPGPRYLVEIARLTEAAAPQDVLGLAWMAVLLGDVPPPTAEVADAAATALLTLTAQRLSATQGVLRDEVVVRDVPVDDARFRRSWLDAHRSLAVPLLTLVGFALDDEGVAALALVERSDPEDAGMDMVEIRLYGGQDDEARLRLEERALRAGVLGVMSDDKDGAIAITTAAPHRR